MSDDIDVDDLEDFGFDDGDWDEPGGGDFDLDEGVAPHSKGPVNDAAKTFAQSAKKAAIDPAAVRTALDGVLPTKITDNIDTFDESKDAMSEYLEEAFESKKSEVKTIADAIQSRIPEGRLNNLITGLREKVGLDDDDSDYDAPTDYMKTDDTNAMLDDMFEKQVALYANESASTQQQAVGEAVERSKDRNEDRVFKASSLSDSASMTKSLHELSMYSRNVTLGYQRKSLELRFKQYYVQKELLRVSSEYYKSSFKLLDDIKHNAGLSDFRKLGLEDRLLKDARGKGVDSVINKMLGSKSRVGKFFGRSLRSGKNLVDKVGNGIGLASMGIGAANQASEMEAMEASMSGIAPKSKTSKASGMLGGLLGGAILSRITNATSVRDGGDDRDPSKLARALKLDKAGLYVKNKVTSGVSAYNSGARGIYNYLDDNEVEHTDSMFTKMKKGLKRGIQNHVFAPDDLNDDIEQESFNITDKTSYTKADSISITKIIPGLLTRIARATNKLAGITDDKLAWDWSKGGFSKSKDLKTKAMKEIDRAGGAGTFEDNIDDVIIGLQEKGANLTNKEIDNLRGTLLDDMFRRQDGAIGMESFQDLTNGKGRDTNHMDKFKGNSKDYADLQAKLQGMNLGKRDQLVIDELLSNVSTNVEYEDTIKVIEGMANNGYTDTLTSVGYIKRSDTGRLSLDREAYRRHLAKEYKNSDKEDLTTDAGLDAQKQRSEENKKDDKEAEEGAEKIFSDIKEGLGKVSNTISKSKVGKKGKDALDKASKSRQAQEGKKLFKKYDKVLADMVDKTLDAGERKKDEYLDAGKKDGAKGVIDLITRDAKEVGVKVSDLNTKENRDKLRKIKDNAVSNTVSVGKTGEQAVNAHIANMKKAHEKDPKKGVAKYLADQATVLGKVVSAGVLVPAFEIFKATSADYKDKFDKSETGKSLYEKKSKAESIAEEYKKKGKKAATDVSNTVKKHKKDFDNSDAGKKFYKGKSDLEESLNTELDKLNNSKLGKAAKSKKDEAVELLSKEKKKLEDKYDKEKEKLETLYHNKEELLEKTKREVADGLNTAKTKADTKVKSFKDGDLNKEGRKVYSSLKSALNSKTDTGYLLKEFNTFFKRGKKVVGDNDGDGVDDTSFRGIFRRRNKKDGEEGKVSNTVKDKPSKKSSGVMGMLTKLMGPLVGILGSVKSVVSALNPLNLLGGIASSIGSISGMFSLMKAGGWLSSIFSKGEKKKKKKKKNGKKRKPKRNIVKGGKAAALMLAGSYAYDALFNNDAEASEEDYVEEEEEEEGGISDLLLDYGTDAVLFHGMGKGFGAIKNAVRLPGASNLVKKKGVKTIAKFGLVQLLKRGALVVGGGAAAALGAPILAVGIGVAGAAWLAYDIYDLIKGESFNPTVLDKARYAEYGLDYDKGMTDDHKIGIRALEALAVRRFEEGGSLGVSEVMTALGYAKGSYDDTVAKSVISWYNNRFKPVLDKHSAVMEYFKPKEGDILTTSVIPKKDYGKYLSMASSEKSNVYDVMSGPYGTTPNRMTTQILINNLVRTSDITKLATTNNTVLDIKKASSENIRPEEVTKGKSKGSALVSGIGSILKSGALGFILYGDEAEASEMHSQPISLKMDRHAQSTLRSSPFLGKQPGKLGRRATVRGSFYDSKSYSQTEAMELTREVAGIMGLNPNALLAIVAIESDFRQFVKNPGKGQTAGGLAQAIDSTWNMWMKQWSSKLNIPAGTTKYNARAALMLAAMNIRQRIKQHGYTNVVELYLCHFRGDAGGPALIKAYNTNPANHVGSAGITQSIVKVNGSYFPRGTKTPLSTLYSRVISAMKSRANKYGFSFEGNILPEGTSVSDYRKNDSNPTLNSPDKIDPMKTGRNAVIKKKDLEKHMTDGGSHHQVDVGKLTDLSMNPYADAVAPGVPAGDVSRTSKPTSTRESLVTVSGILESILKVSEAQVEAIKESNSKELDINIKHTVAEGEVIAEEKVKPKKKNRSLLSGNGMSVNTSVPTVGLSTRRSKV